MYIRLNMGVMPADSELTKQLSSHTLSFYSTTLENSRKFTINSNKLGKYHKWSLTICDGCFDTLKSSKIQS